MWIFAIGFILSIGSGCSSKTTPKETLEYTTQVHKVTYQPVDCGSLKLKGIGIQLEDPNEHAGSEKNQRIVTRNLVVLDYQLREAQTILECYQSNYQKMVRELNLQPTTKN